MMIWIVLLIAILGLLYIYTIITYNYWRKRKVYYETPIPIFGNFLRVFLRQEQIGNVIKDIYDKTDDNTPYFGFYVFHRPYIVMKSKKMIKNILIKDFSSFVNRFQYTNEEVDPLSANTLFALKNEVWRTLRTKLTPVFTSGKMKMMLPLIKDVTTQLEMILEEQDGQEMDVMELAKRYAVDVISSCAFGIEAKSLTIKNAEIHLMVLRLLDQKGFKRTFALFAWIFCPILVEILRLNLADPEAVKFLTEVYRHSSEQRKKQNIMRNDLIDILNAVKEEETKNDLFKFDDAKMSAQAIVFFNSGAQGASTILSLCLYELAINPEIQSLLREEIEKNLDSEGFISYESLFEMEYLDLVVKETLRKYPFIQFMQRYAENDHIIEETGLKIEKGTHVLFPILALHYDPQYYSDPYKFDPERFRGEKMKDLQYVYLPFGDGPRKCIGERFAVMSVKIGLAMFLKTVEVSPGRKTNIPLKFTKGATFTTPKNGTVYLTIKKLNSIIPKSQ